MAQRITLNVRELDYNNAKKEFLSDYFLEQVESGSMSFFQALLTQNKVKKTAKQAIKDNRHGLCIDATDAVFFDDLKNRAS